MVKTEKKAKLPKQQLTILAISRFAEPVASTSVYPYIPELIESFNIPVDQIAKYSGWLSAVFSLSQCITAIGWGRASDRFGRKPMIILALLLIMISSVLFGFSSSLAMAFITRAVQGGSSGNVGIIRTAVAEMVPQKELQPTAFSIMPLVWNIGSIFGPSLGGSLVKPVQRYPNLFKGFTLLEKYPFALPNLLISVFFLIGILSAFFFLRETHEEKKDRRDIGLALGSIITRPCTKRRKPTWTSNDEADPFLGESGRVLTKMGDAKEEMTKGRVGWKGVFNRHSTINLIAYTGLAMHSVAFDQLVPVFLHHPRNAAEQRGSFFKFTNGFNLTSSQIGVLFTVYGIYGMVVQFALFPPTARKFGVLNCFRICVLTFPIIYVLIPFTSLLPTNGQRQGFCLALMLVKGAAGIFAFPCSTILLTNSATSLRVLGTLNGVATSVSAMGRAVGPALCGAMFTFGIDIGYVIVPWWTLATIATIAAIPVFFLVELEGFGGKPVNNEDSDDEDDEEETRPDQTASAATGVDVSIANGQLPDIPDIEVVDYEDESADESVPFIGQEESENPFNRSR